MVLETFRQALQNVWSNKLRTFLTMLGIIIGVMAVIVIVGLGNGMTRSMRDSFSAMGTNTLSIQIWGYGSRTATVDDLYDLVKKNPKLLSSISPQLDFSDNTPKVGTTTYRYSEMYGVDENYIEIEGLHPCQGPEHPVYGHRRQQADLRHRRLHQPHGLRRQCGGPDHQAWPVQVPHRGRAEGQNLQPRPAGGQRRRQRLPALHHSHAPFQRKLAGLLLRHHGGFNIHGFIPQQPVTVLLGDTVPGETFLTVHMIKLGLAVDDSTRKHS